jgi:hypothetical protein
MVRNGPTKHRRRDIPVQLGVRTCALLLPPLAMAAAVALFAHYPSEDAAPQREDPQPAAVSTIAKTVSMAPRADREATYALAGAERKFTGRPPDVEQHLPLEQRAPKEDRSASGQLPATKNPDRFEASDPAADTAAYFGPAAVTVVRVVKAGAPPVTAALEATPPAATAAALPPPVSRAWVARSRPFHARARIKRHEVGRHETGRQEPRTVHVAKQQHPRAPSGTVRAHTRRG